MKKRKLRRLYALSPFRAEAANRSRCVRVPMFLTAKEVQLVKEWARNIDLPVYTANPEFDLDEGRPVSVTKYVSTAHIFRNEFAWLHSKIRELVCTVSARQHWHFNTYSEHFQLRVAEWHEMWEGGSLDSFNHYDIGSLVTVDLCLEEALQGARFQTVGTNNATTDYPFHAGDALVFVSHKLHRVTPLEKGHREVLVMEYWRGAARACGHRCDHSQGGCEFTEDDS